jgi:hypothetical protein
MSTMISHSKKFIFIHSYKVAGSSISDVLSKYEPHYLLRGALRKVGYHKYYPTLANFPQHATALFVRNLIDKETFNTCYKFVFVRNPWDWQVSLYHYMLQSQRHHQHNLIKCLTFEEYVDWRVNNDLRLQCEWFVDEQENMLVDFIGQFENLEKDFAKICEFLSIEMRLPHKNRSKHRSYRDYYNDRTYKLIQESFAKDIALFDYEF